MIYRTEVDNSKYVIVTYYLKSKTNLRDAAWNLAIGQSVGNPNVRNEWETDELFENHSCMILADESDLEKVSEGIVDIAFPIINIDFRTDGVAHLLVNIMGGQLDIDLVEKCAVKDIEFPECVKRCFLGPKYGISGVREFTGVHDKPILGSIIKPKTGISPSVLLDMVKQLVDGGVNFIKEDEILSDPSFCKIEDRIPMIMDYLDGRDVIYSASIHADYPYILDRVKQVHELGGNSVHINFWCGLGVYKAVRELDLPMFIHFQKSGDKILTNRNHDFYIDWVVICKLAGMMGVDFIHAGMIGGYYKWEEAETFDAVKTLNEYNVVPALSCGFQPGITDFVTSRVGIDYMANVGGAIHGHPNGTTAGAKAMRQAIDKKYGTEYNQATEKWGKVNERAWQDDLNKDIRFSGEDADKKNNQDRPFCNKVHDVEFTPCNRELLLESFLDIKDTCEVIVEIGVARNNDPKQSSTNVFLTNKNKDTLFLGVDKDGKTKVDDHENNVYTIKTDSSDYYNMLRELNRLGYNHIDYLFIDGYHSINQVLDDWEYTRILSKGGIVGIHDSTKHPGPQLFIENINTDIWEVVKLCEDDNGISFLRRK